MALELVPRSMQGIEGRVEYSPIEGSANGEIPLQDGYFEVNSFDGSPEEITLRWIDFYRN